ncbi:translation factor [Ordospora colligata]|uniref:Threonylcarbamoyl-AMP synthase n=1 Tax=Ordospora colligata OC4 TaxID=1354746 RepID=A0A0B2UI08_9MICR|nr:translation factor [Ordospora colligata OC4]KHN68983.1 translation factor [Ordospora colligata OC4]TBU14258.1 translation factor [Ordospora colligata]TBU17879.1 translation factor [Ordospora colligata]
MRRVKAEDIDMETVIECFKDVVAVPTETVYGLAADIRCESAVERIFELKGRPGDNPLIVHVCSIDMLKSIISEPIPKEYQRLIDRFWPGPLTLLFKTKCDISLRVRGGLDTVAVRMPGNKCFLNIIERLGAPIAAPSANISGRPSPTSADHVIEDFGERIGLVIDGGPCSVGLESTVVSMMEGKLHVLRPGGISLEELTEVACCDVVVSNKMLENGKVYSPGQKYKHYSPTARLILFKGPENEIGERMQEYILSNLKVKKWGIALHSNVCIGKIDDKSKVNIFDMGCEKRVISRRLFEGIRSLDKVSEVILVAGVTLSGEGSAIMDRLERASDMIFE